MEKQDRRDHSQQGSPAQEKKKYSAPVLRDYGSLQNVTKSGGSGSNDFLGMQDGMGMN